MDLAYPVKDTITIDGKEYPLNLAFDNVLRMFDLLEDELITDATKINTGLILLTGHGFDDYSLEEKNILFYELFIEAIGNPQNAIEESVDIAGNPMPTKDEKTENNFSIKEDGAYIYASFMSDYGIDLFEEQGKLSWQKFNALLSGLSDDSKFMRVIDIRTRELPTGKGTEKERSQLIKLKKQYELKG